MTPAEVALGYLGSFAQGEADAVVRWVTEDFVNDHTSALGSGCRGRETYAGRLPGFLGAFRELRYTAEQTITEGSSVCVPYRMTAISDDSPIDLRGVMVIEVRDDLVAKRTDYWDSLLFLQQTGQA